ncbi:ImmA/IrrE family metallo-endopeptidase [Megamonas funiformis]|nr:ImmA/IrrE family metallo-endopeptidase [Megamonas funiformis]
MNIDVLQLKLPNTIRGFLVRVLRRKFIALNANLPYEAQKIVVCHELGHAILHKGYGYYLHADMSYYVPSRREKEANQFAIHLLSHSSDLDADLITKVISEKDPDPREVHKILSTLL